MLTTGNSIVALIGPLKRDVLPTSFEYTVVPIKSPDEVKMRTEASALKHMVRVAANRENLSAYQNIVGLKPFYTPSLSEYCGGCPT